MTRRYDSFGSAELVRTCPDNYYKDDAPHQVHGGIVQIRPSTMLMLTACKLTFL